MEAAFAPEFFCAVCKTKLSAEGATCPECERMAKERAQEEALREAAERAASMPRKAPGWVWPVGIAVAVVLVVIILFWLLG